jgi:hypothetical protein
MKTVKESKKFHDEGPLLSVKNQSFSTISEGHLLSDYGSKTIIGPYMAYFR